MPTEPRWTLIVLAVLLVLFGALEVDAIHNDNAIEQALSGLGIVGSVILLWWRR